MVILYTCTLYLCVCVCVCMCVSDDEWVTYMCVWWRMDEDAEVVIIVAAIVVSISSANEIKCKRTLSLWKDSCRDHLQGSVTGIHSLLWQKWECIVTRTLCLGYIFHRTMENFQYTSRFVSWYANWESVSVTINNTVDLLARVRVLAEMRREHLCNYK